MMRSTGQSAAVEEAEQSEDTLQRFEVSLSTRTKVPTQRLGEFLGWDEAQVRHEAKVVTRVLRRFAEAVVHSMEDPSSVHDFLVELDLKTISRDHDWRAIFSTIRCQDAAGGDRYKRAVLIKYLQYLSFRKRLLDFIHARKAGLEETDEMSSDLTLVPSDESSVMPLAHARGGVSDGFGRLPLGETVEVRVGEDEVLEVLLARHRFELVGGDHPYVVDENGVTCFVKPGRNMVGRHPESDLTVDANFGDVSRAHMVLEWDGRACFRFMDLSSRGTSLRENVLRAASEVDRAEDLLQF
jgi:hypothetical protein